METPLPLSFLKRPLSFFTFFYRIKEGSGRGSNHEVKVSFLSGSHFVSPLVNPIRLRLYSSSLLFTTPTRSLTYSDYERILPNVSYVPPSVLRHYSLKSIGLSTPFRPDDFHYSRSREFFLTTIILFDNKT